MRSCWSCGHRARSSGQHIRSASAPRRTQDMTQRGHHRLRRARSLAAVLGALGAYSLSSSSARASISSASLRNGSEIAVRAVPAMPRKRSARARRNWTACSGATLGPKLQGRQRHDYHESNTRPRERRKGSDNQDRPLPTCCGRRRSLAMRGRRIGVVIRLRPTIAVIFPASLFRFGEERGAIRVPTTVVIVRDEVRHAWASPAP